MPGQVGVDLADDEPEQQDRERHREPAPRRSPGARADVPAQAARDLPDGAQAAAPERRPADAAGDALGRRRRRPPRDPLPHPEPHSEPSDPRGRVGERRLAVAGRPRAAPTVDRRRRAAPPPRPAPPAPRAGHRTAASPRAARPTRPSRLPLRGALEQLADPRRGIVALLRELGQLVAEHDAPERRVQLRGPDRVDPRRARRASAAASRSSRDSSGRPVLELRDDRAHALVVGLEPPGEQPERPVVETFASPRTAGGTWPMASDGRRVRRLGRQQPRSIVPPRRQPAGHRRLAGRVELPGQPQGEVGDRPLPPLPERRDRASPRWPADRRARSTTRRRRSRPAQVRDQVPHERLGPAVAVVAGQAREPRPRMPERQHLRPQVQEPHVGVPAQRRRQRPRIRVETARRRPRRPRDPGHQRDQRPRRRIGPEQLQRQVLGVGRRDVVQRDDQQQPDREVGQRGRIRERERIRRTRAA